MLKAIARVVARSIALTIILGGGTYLAVTQPDVTPIPDSSAPVKGSAAWIMDRHDCWTGGEGHPLPGHVVLVDGTGYRYAGWRATGWALENLGDSSIVAFCK